MRGLRSSSRIAIYLESDHLVMHGSLTDSPGCVLRGVVVLTLRNPTKVKSIMLHLNGVRTAQWRTARQHYGHAHISQDAKSVLNHTWTFLPPRSSPYYFQAGRYPFEFELPLPGSLPESVNIGHHYRVQYDLQAIVQRPTFCPNLTAYQPLHVSRQMSPTVGPDILAPISVSNVWAGKISYVISLPTKLFSLGDRIPITMQITMLTQRLRLRYLSCTLEEHMTCKPHSSWFNGESPSSERIITREMDGDLNVNDSVLTTTLRLNIPSSPPEVQCSVHSDAVRVRHKVKMVLSIENPDGHLSELRVALPVTIHVTDLSRLPSYEDAWKSFPYDPAQLADILLPTLPESGCLSRSLSKGRKTRDLANRRSLNKLIATLPSYSSSLAERVQAPTSHVH